MYFKKLFQFRSVSYRRGLATIVTTGILLAATSVLGASMLAWSHSELSVHQLEIEEVFNTQMNKLNENILIENIWFALPAGAMSNNHLNVTFSNIGILGLNVTSIQITNVTAGNTTSFDYDFTDIGMIKSAIISKNVTYPWQSDDEIDVLIITNRGNQFITQVVAP
jgi:hypothetical protein